MLNSVLLPEPLGPMIEMYSLRLMEMETPFSAWTSVSPILYERLTSMVRTDCSARVVVMSQPSSLQSAASAPLAKRDRRPRRSSARFPPLSRSRSRSQAPSPEDSSMHNFHSLHSRRSDSSPAQE